MAKTIVGCKLPSGLVMELIDPPTQEHSLNPVPRKPNAYVELNGARSVRGGRVLRLNPEPAYGKTYVDSEFAAEWFRRNAQLPCVVNGSVFSADNEKDFETKAKAGLIEVSGFEPINPSGDLRTPAGVEPDPDQMQKFASQRSGAAA